ncbi:enoyl-CoA hydratase/isomerase family protein [Euzebya tangerina]|uniref:enoyl-CoA hydratase/isomerase family protein n=1 Tax=Euzebya tangerina TaxID=591198 RepID=UPI000E322194|nr:enoyl-CoA hydratase/isomerase family protein [Euzebya tangerina]
MNDSYGMLTVAVDDGICFVTLDRPTKLNTMTFAFWTDLQDLLADATADDDVRVLVVHGAGDNFSAGGDIEGFGGLDDIPARREYQELAFAAFRAFETFPKPTIAAVHGYALGGGCELTMVTDLVICDTTAQFGTPEASVGLMPGLGVVRGRANSNLHWLKLMIFTGQRLGAEEAKAAGLVTTVVPEGTHLEEARRLAGLIAAKPATALRVAKGILNRGSAEGYEYSVEATALLHSTNDQAEGVAAFVERRAPDFKDR